MGKIIYLGNKSFQLQYKNENLIIDPYLKWLHTKNLLNKDDPLSFTFADNIKHRFRSIHVRELTTLVEQMDYVLLSSPNYSHLEQLRELMEKNPNLLIIAPGTLVIKIKHKLKKWIPKGVDFISIQNGETVRFTHFQLKAIPTENDRFSMKVLRDYDKNSLSFSINCSSLQLYHSGVGVGKPLNLDSINIAILPMSFSYYNDIDILQKFCKHYKPKLIIPYLYNSKVYHDIIANQNQLHDKTKVYFPRIGLPIEWN